MRELALTNKGMYKNIPLLDEEMYNEMSNVFDHICRRRQMRDATFMSSRVTRRCVKAWLPAE